MRNFTSRLWTFLGSGYLAVALIAILGVVLGMATFYESRTTTAAAAASYYHSTWFAVILLLVGVNVTVAAFRRWPWQPKHAGFLITHLAIDLLLIGSLLTMAIGVDGTMSITEGGKSNRLALDSTVIRVDGSDVSPARAGARVSLDDGRTLQVEQLLESALPTVDVKEDGDKENPALHFHIGNGKANTEGWLVARTPELASQALGPLHASLTEVDRLPDAAARPTIQLTFGKRTVDVPIGKVGETAEVAGSGYQLRVLAVYKRAGVDKKSLVERPSGAENPAVRFELLKDGKSETHVAFTRFPEFPTYAGKGVPPSGVRARYQDGPAGGGPTAAFFWLPDGKVFLRLAGKTIPVEVGKDVDTPWMGMKLRVDHVVDRARIASVYAPAPQGAAAVQVSLGGEKAWIGLEEQAKIGGRTVGFGADNIALGATIQLDKFEMKTNPGTSNAASFASTVHVRGAADDFTARISMNEPLQYAGYTFYQSGYVPGQGGPNTTILRVAKVPGILLKYEGTALLVLGIMWLFYIEPALARRRLAALASPKAARAPRRRLATSTALLVAVVMALGALPAVAQAPQNPHGTQSAPADPQGVPADPHGTQGVPADPHGAQGVPADPHGTQGAPADPHGTQGVPADPHGTKAAPHGGMDPHAQGGGPAANPHSADTMARADSVPPPTTLDLHAASRLPVQANGRVRPLDTYARELVMAVTGRESFEGREPVDLLLSWTTHGPAWSQKNLIYVPNKALKVELGLDPEQTRFSLQALAANKKLHELSQAARAKEKDQTSTAVERAASEAFDRVAVLEAVFSGRVLAIVPPNADADASWLSPAELEGMDADSAKLVVAFFRAYIESDPRFPQAATDLQNGMRARGGDAYLAPQAIELEMLYNKMRPFRTAWELYLAALIFFGLGTFWKGLRPIALTLAVGGLFVHTAGLVMRMLIAHRPPVTNMYESVVWVAWGCAALGLALTWKHRHAGAAVAAGVMATLLLIVTDALPGALDPSIQPLMPVLRSNFWLTVHVLTITLSYAAFALALSLGHAWLLVKSNAEKRSDISKFLNATLRVGVLLLAAGTLLGGVWAQYSWGRFWGWDPKEVWALIALLGYLALLHAQFAGWIGARGTAVGAILGFLGVLMAWYGVNYILGKGLHSYGFGSGGTEWVAAFVGAELLFLALTTGKRR